MDMLKRPVNVGFSGGEKKRAEMVQMGILDPKLAILDETDSGLDIDALRVVRRRHQRDHAQARQGRAAHHPLPAPARLCEARFRACAGGGRIVRSAAARNLRWSWNARAMERWRRDALALPTRRDEAWRYSDLDCAGCRVWPVPAPERIVAGCG
jgi:ABC-type Na+ transport system ATPase subunit NatA